MEWKSVEGPRQGWGRTGHVASFLVAVVLGFAAFDASAQQQSSIPSLRPGTDRLTADRTAALPPLPDAGAASVVLPEPLGLADADRYRQIFDLQRVGKYRQAELVIGWLGDHRLVGHVLAQRYLASDYRTSYAELARWLSLYADHPEAVRLYALAMQRRPAGSAPPHKPEVDSFQAGTTEGSSIAADPRWQSGLAAWRRHDLGWAASAFEKVASDDHDSPWDRAAAAYWAARAHLKNREPGKVSRWLRVAAQYPRTFYGQLAGRALSPASTGR